MQSIVFLYVKFWNVDGLVYGNFFLIRSQHQNIASNHFDILCTVRLDKDLVYLKITFLANGYPSEISICSANTGSKYIS